MGVSCVYIWANVYVCIRDRKKMFLASKDKLVLKSSPRPASLQFCLGGPSPRVSGSSSHRLSLRIPGQGGPGDVAGRPHERGGPSPTFFT